MSVHAAAFASISPLILHLQNSLTADIRAHERKRTFCFPFLKNVEPSCAETIVEKIDRKRREWISCSPICSMMEAWLMGSRSRFIQNGTHHAHRALPGTVCQSADLHFSSSLTLSLHVSCSLSLSVFLEMKSLFSYVKNLRNSTVQSALSSCVWNSLIPPGNEGWMLSETKNRKNNILWYQWDCLCVCVWLYTREPRITLHRLRQHTFVIVDLIRMHILHTRFSHYLAFGSAPSGEEGSATESNSNQQSRPTSSFPTHFTVSIKCRLDARFLCHFPLEIYSSRFK